LRKFNFPQKLTKLIEISVIETFVKIKIVNASTDPILVKSGIRQRNPMSLILFNLILEKVIREIDIRPQEGVKL